jgi:hypothetical protein
VTGRAGRDPDGRAWYFSRPRRGLSLPAAGQGSPRCSSPPFVARGARPNANRLLDRVIELLRARDAGSFQSSARSDPRMPRAGAGRIEASPSPLHDRDGRLDGRERRLVLELSALRFEHPAQDTPGNDRAVPAMSGARGDRDRAVLLRAAPSRALPGRLGAVCRATRRYRHREGRAQGDGRLAAAADLATSPRRPSAHP